MKWIYLVAGVALFIKLILLSIAPETTDLAIVDTVVAQSGVTNAVSGIIFRNRLYDTLFEVVVFSVAVMGVRFLIADERVTESVRVFTDAPSVVLAQLGATIAALIGVELAIRGHLSPGGGFAAGVAGGTAIGLIAVTSSLPVMESAYKRWHAAKVEKVSVLVFIVIAALSLSGVALPFGQLGALFSGGWIPLLNILVALKVALGAWAVLLLFIRYRGLL